MAITEPGPIGRWVQRGDVPLAGLVVGVEDDGRVWVLWGDTAIAYTEISAGRPHHPDARLEDRSELIPLQRPA